MPIDYREVPVRGIILDALREGPCRCWESTQDICLQSDVSHFWKVVQDMVPDWMPSGAVDVREGDGL